MQLENTFEVPVPVAEAWAVLLDINRVAPCMPGATLEGVDGDEYTGRVRVKVGPIAMSYRGTARFASLDPDRHVAVIEASGKETRGASTARATITTELHDQGSSTKVRVRTDLTITGRPAQLGRGVLAEVSGKLVDQFAEALAREVTSEQPAAPPPPAQPATPAPAMETTADASAPHYPPTAPRAGEPIDLLDVAGGAVMKRAVPALVGLVLLAWLVSRWLARRGK
ncbi:MAG: SRPBCC family protein [Mycobacteriales bacterium]